MIYIFYSADRHCLFCSTSFLHCTVCQCTPFRARHGTSMLHRGHSGWGRFPSFNITTVSWTCQCHKCNRMAVRVTASPLHPSIGKGLGPSFAWNVIRNLLVLSTLLPSPSPSFFPAPPLTIPCWVWWWIDSDHISRSFPHSGCFIRSCYLSWLLHPSLVI